MALIECNDSQESRASSIRGGQVVLTDQTTLLAGSSYCNLAEARLAVRYRVCCDLTKRYFELASEFRLQVVLGKDDNTSRSSDWREQPTPICHDDNFHHPLPEPRALQPMRAAASGSQERPNLLLALLSMHCYLKHQNLYYIAGPLRC